MKDWKHFLKGYLHIRLMGNAPERFLNLCANHEMEVWNLQHVNNCYEMNMTIDSFYRLQPLCRKTKSRIKIMGKYGLPFFFYKNKKRKAFFVGIFLCIGLLIGMSRYIWNIHVEGNLTYSTQSILRYLDELDVHHGISKSKIDCSHISSQIRKEFPDIIWVSTKIQGTRLLLEIQENTDRYVKEAVSEEPCDLVADKSGTVVSMITRSGTPLKQKGDYCEKGEIIVQGRVDIVNDAGEVFEHSYVHADADIYLETNYQYYQEFPLAYDKREYTGNSKKYYFLQAMGYYGTTRGKKPAFPTYDRVSDAKYVRLTENFLLPIMYGIETDYEYEILHLNYTEEEAIQKAEKELKRFLEKLEEKGVQICANHVKIGVTDSACIAKGSLVVIQKVGKEQTVEEVNIERTANADE